MPIVVVGLMMTACSVAPMAGEPSAPAESPPTASVTSEPTGVVLSSVPIGVEAPPECGFPPGTALEFAGRSTTETLDVQEAIGDPMSDDPADIYITRDKLDQGDLHGRLVCAIYVDSGGFVEVTVHPDDGGRLVPPTPYPSATSPASGLTESEALDVARSQLEHPDAWDIGVAEPGPIGQVLPFLLQDSHYEWAHDLTADRWVWRVFAVRGDEGIDVVIDYVDGSVLGTVSSIVN